jgi:ABC-type polysaccharide/polyol phosphate export permease
MLWGFWTLSRTAYRGLYDPGTPIAYLNTLVVRPCFTVLTFGYLVSSVTSGSQVRAAVVGASVLALNWTTIGAALQTVGWELGNGTLGMTIASPVSRARLLASRGVLHIPNGLLTATSAVLIGTFAFDLSFSGVTWYGLAVSLVLISLTFTAVGLFAGVVSLGLREVWALLGVISVTLYTLSGAIVPLESLPESVQAAASVVPGRWGIGALHRALDGDGITDLAPYWAAEIAVGLVYFGLAVGAMWVYERNAQRRGSVDLV